MLTLTPFADEAEYQQFYELEPPVAVNYDDWRAMVAQPNWAVFAVRKNESFVGGLLLEKLAADVCEFHYSIKRKTVTPFESARLLIETGKMLFTEGIERLQCVVPSSNRAANRLAKACHLSFETFHVRRNQLFACYVLHKQTYFAQPHIWEIENA